jgi:hypothetical protein
MSQPLQRLVSVMLGASLAIVSSLAVGTLSRARAVALPVITVSSPYQDQGLTGTQSVTWMSGMATSSGSTIVSVKVKIAIRGTYGTTCAVNADPGATICYVQSGGTTFGASSHFFTCDLSAPNTATTSFSCGPGAAYGNASLPAEGSYSIQYQVNDAAGNQVFFPPGATNGNPTGTPSQLDFEYGAASTGSDPVFGNLLFGRAQWTQDDPGNCTALPNTGAGQQTVNFDQISSFLYAESPNGVYATPLVVTNWATSAQDGSPCTMGNIYDSWSELQNDWNLYGEYPGTESEDYPGSYGALETSQAAETTGAASTCETDMALGSVMYPCTGIFAYPGNRYYCTSADPCNSGDGTSGSAGLDLPVQCVTLPNTCGASSVEHNFDYGREYGQWINWLPQGGNSSNSNVAGLMDTISVNGGTTADDASGVTCGADICWSSTGATVYTPPGQLAEIAEDNAVYSTTHSGSVPTVEFYKFLVGACTNCGVNSNLSWNCSGAANTHFTFNTEAYCWDDFQTFINDIPQDGDNFWYGPAYTYSAIT